MSAALAGGQAGAMAEELVASIDAMAARLDEDDDATLDVEALTLACQNLVAWAGRFDKRVSGERAVEPSEEERALVGEVLKALRRAGALLSTRKEGIGERLQEARHSRRSIGGYAFLKPAGSERQFISFKA